MQLVGFCVEVEDHWESYAATLDEAGLSIEVRRMMFCDRYSVPLGVTGAVALNGVWLLGSGDWHVGIDTTTSDWSCWHAQTLLWCVRMPMRLTVALDEAFQSGSVQQAR